mmetsp:Transcript_10008/g.19783  ORF Transcript_10008/g.19783 Transcript_10008/m.19783 type:complete len:148 (-) Transcript_10008:26-469(-)
MAKWGFSPFCSPNPLLLTLSRNRSKLFCLASSTNKASMQGLKRLASRIRNYFTDQDSHLLEEVRHYQTETIKLIKHQAKMREVHERKCKYEKEIAVSRFHSEFEEIFKQYSSLLASTDCKGHEEFTEGLKAIRDQFSTALANHKPRN